MGEKNGGRIIINVMTINTGPLHLFFCSCRGKFKSERDYCDLEDGNSDVLVLGFEPALINYAGLGRIRKEMTTGTSVTSAVKSPLSPSTQSWTLFKKNPPSSSSVAPITEAMEATVTQGPSPSAVPITENISTVKRSITKKIAGEKVVQLLAKGVWVLRRLATSVCEVTFVNRLEDTGDITKKIFNMKVSR